MNLARVNILGVGISAISEEEAVNQISEWVESGARQYVSVCTVHTVMECQSNLRMRRAVNGAGMATPDGMPLVWLGRHYSQRPVTRVYGPDLMLALCQHSVTTGYRHYFYGGQEGVPERLADALGQRFPGLRIAGAFSPPFRPVSDLDTPDDCQRIDQAQADIVWVGLGTPKQDLWMAANRPKLEAPVLIGVGAAFDFHTGAKKQAPRWMQQNGLEWLFRLLSEPSRLWQRYLIYNPLFITLVLLQRLGLRRYPLDDIVKVEQ